MSLNSLGLKGVVENGAAVIDHAVEDRIGGEQLLVAQGPVLGCTLFGVDLDLGLDFRAGVDSIFENRVRDEKEFIL